MHRRRFMLLAVTLVALNTFFWVAQSGFALPKAIIQDFFGSRMVRAEVLVVAPDGSTQDYRIDQGAITQVSGGTITLRERNGDIVPIAVADDVTVHAGLRTIPASRLQRGMQVTVFRLANAPADTIDVTGVGGGRGR